MLFDRASHGKTGAGMITPIRHQPVELHIVAEGRRQNALLLQRLFERKSEQTADAATSQLAHFNDVGAD